MQVEKGSCLSLPVTSFINFDETPREDLGNQKVNINVHSRLRSPSSVVIM